MSFRDILERLASVLLLQKKTEEKPQFLNSLEEALRDTSYGPSTEMEPGPDPTTPSSIGSLTGREMPEPSRDRLEALMKDFAIESAVFSALKAEQELGIDLEPGSFYLGMCYQFAQLTGMSMDETIQQKRDEFLEIIHKIRDRYVDEKMNSA